MKPAPFTLHRPDTLEAAVALLAELGEEARPIAGGQSLVAMMNLRVARPEHLVDLNRIGELTGIVLNGEHVRIGAMTRQSMLLDDPLIARHAPLIAAAMPYVGHVQTRSRGTVGGSLAHADPAAELPLVMSALGAEFGLTGEKGERVLPAADFFQDALTTAIEPGEVLTQVVVPIAPKDAKVSFHEIARRHGDFAIAAAAAQWSPSQQQARIGLGGVGPVPIRCRAAEADLEAGRSEIGAEDDLSGIEIQEDPQASAAYRHRLAHILLARCLTEVRGS